MSLRRHLIGHLRTGRRVLRQFERVVGDCAEGRRSRLVGREAPVADGTFEPRLSSTQPIRDTEGAAQKRHNIRLAAEPLEDRVVAPGRIFSFWHLIGRPTAGRGFRAGRSIVGGELVREIGGGLCQLAGLLHVVGLKAGLGILESHAHSRDLYDETTRYAPLGSDAAVAYPHKDLRLENTLDQPVSFGVEVESDRICVTLTAPQPVDEFTTVFIRHDSRRRRLAATYRRCPKSGKRTLLRVATYLVYDSVADDESSVSDASR